MKKSDVLKLLFEQGEIVSFVATPIKETKAIGERAAEIITGWHYEIDIEMQNE